MSNKPRPVDHHGAPRMIDDTPRALGRRCYTPMGGAATRCGLPGDVVRTVTRESMVTCEDCVSLIRKDEHDAEEAPCD